MRRTLLALALTLTLALAATALAAAPQAAQTTKDAPRLEDVLAYIDLFGYRKMMELTVDQHLAGLVETLAAQREDIPPRSLEIIQQELRKGLNAATERSLREMARVFQRHLTQADVTYLLGIGRDPRMQKVVKLQPKLALELGPIAEGLAKDVYREAAPRIEERLKRLEGGENI